MEDGISNCRDLSADGVLGKCTQAHRGQAKHWFFPGGDCAAQGTFDSAWPLLCSLQRVREGLLVSSRSRPGMH